ncbi:MAG: hypothetical protein MJ225_04340 [Bacilli bacterium]|nr:hypothetical protein [Bacilli bacterium]
MKKQKIPYIGIVYSILLMVIGILAVVFAIVNKENVEKMLSYSLAVGLFVLAFVYILNTIITKVNEIFSMSLVLGSSAIALGVVLIVEPAFLPVAFILFLAALLVVLAGVCLIKGILAIVHKEKGKLIFGYFAVAVIAGAIGGLIFGFRETSTKIIYILIGVSILASGIMGLVYAIKGNANKPAEAK